MKTKRITTLAIFLTVSIILSIIESMLPVIPIPGVKLGLANIVTLVVLYRYSGKDALILVMMRIVLVGLLRGNIFSVTFYLSLSGGTIAYLMMYIFKHLNIFSVIGISITGSLGHSIGQIFAAIFFIEQAKIIYYLPYILILSIFTGIFTGILSKRVLDILKKA